MLGRRTRALHPVGACTHRRTQTSSREGASATHPRRPRERIRGPGPHRTGRAPRRRRMPEQGPPGRGHLRRRRPPELACLVGRLPPVPASVRHEEIHDDDL